MFLKHREGLINLFRKYASDSPTMTRDQCKELAHGLNIIDEALTEHDVIQILRKVQGDGDRVEDTAGEAETVDGKEATEELGYFEFLEFLAVIALHKEADPYMVVSEKVSSFLEAYIG